MPYKNKELGRILKREYYRLYRERHIAKQKEYAAHPEVRERIREYDRIRNQRSERKLQKREYSKRPEVRERKNELSRKYYRERKERIKATLGSMPSARQLDKERFWMSRASKILSGEHVELQESQDQKESRRRRDATRRAYRARPEVRDRIRRYDRICKQQPDRKLQRRLAYRKRKQAM